MDGQDEPAHIKVWMNHFFSHKAKTKIKIYLNFGCHPKKINRASTPKGGRWLIIELHRLQHQSQLDAIEFSELLAQSCCQPLPKSQ